MYRYTKRHIRKPATAGFDLYWHDENKDDVGKWPPGGWLHLSADDAAARIKAMRHLQIVTAGIRMKLLQRDAHITAADCQQIFIDWISGGKLWPPNLPADEWRSFMEYVETAIQLGGIDVW